ncbi:MAG TPA: GNAT family N-acetyltransferase [Terriglobia bacterium]|nr:GNAT family N-acetyltransferase [Terriglobia bacterium]
MEIIDIRHFAARDFEPLLESESAAWLTRLRWDYSSSSRAIAACLAEKRLSGYALLEGSRIRGYSFFVYEGEKGLIGGLFVEPGSAAKEWALVLLEHIIETLKSSPGVRRVEAQLPHFAFQDLEDCFRRHRFQGFLRRFMSLRLEGRPTVHGAEGDGARKAPFSIEPWQRKHDEGAARLLYLAYRNHVDALINDQYCSLPGSSRLIENIVHLRGCGVSVPEASLVAVDRTTQQLAGILALTTVRPLTAHVPQVAVASEFQRRGAGAGLMESAFRELDRLGFKEVSLTVTDQNEDAVRFYDRLGFDTFCTFGAFVWNRGGGE